MSSGLPLADQAHLVRKSVAWSDLRRGVFLAAVAVVSKRLGRRLTEG